MYIMIGLMALSKNNAVYNKVIDIIWYLYWLKKINIIIIKIIRVPFVKININTIIYNNYISRWWNNNKFMTIVLSYLGLFLGWPVTFSLVGTRLVAGGFLVFTQLDTPEVRFFDILSILIYILCILWTPGLK